MNKTLCVIATLLPFFVGDLNSQEILHFEPIVDLQQSADGISFPPVFVAFPPGESDRGFVVSLNGEVRVVDIKTREISSEPFLIVDDLWDGFGGLYSVAFHPDYRFNGRLFVCYAAANGDFVIQEYVRQSPDDAIAGEKVFVIEHDSVLDYGGWMGFGIDGFLYISVGGGLRSSNRPTLGGTIMRINVDADDFPGRDDLNYSIPAENPLASTPGYEEVIATGLKNAWRCSFDSQGNLFIGALGTIYREEIELIPANHPEALNFGFPCFEGLLEQQDPAVCDFAGLPFTLPIFEYEHSEELSGIIGGYVIEQEIIPELTGSYI